MEQVKKKTILILLAVVGISCLMAQNGNLVFEHINITDGLSSNNVQSIFQDKDGFLWIGTADGLNRYDGYSFTTFRNDPQDATSISNNSIWSIYEDKFGDLWIGTEDGLNLFNRDNEIFTAYRYNRRTTITAQIASWLNLVDDIHGDMNGNLWFGTGIQGLVKFDRKTKKFTSFLLDTVSSNNGVNDVINDLKDTQKLWIGGALLGLCSFDIEKGKFTFFRQNTKRPKDPTKDFINSIIQDKNGNIWSGTWNGGLKKFTPSTGQFIRYKHNPGNPATLSNNSIRSLFISPDKPNILWIGTNDGLNRFDIRKQIFTVYKSNADDPKTLSGNIITAIFKDRSGVLWIGTRSGLNKMDPGRVPFRFHKNSQEKEGLNSNGVYAITTSAINPNILWTGSGHGLIQYDRNSKTPSYYKHGIEIPININGETIRALYEDPDEAGEALWVTAERKGLIRIDLKKYKYQHYSYNPDDRALVSSNTILQIHKTRDGMFWLTTLDGLNKFNRKKGTFTRYLHQDTTYVPVLQNLSEEIVLTRKPLASILKVKNSVNLSRTFALAKNTRVLIIAMGEGAQLLSMSGGREKMFDYGWLENRVGKIIWKLKLKLSKHAGGDVKNRMQIGVLNLAPGQYKLSYLSDESHSFGEWNAAAPINQNLWGIQILEISASEYKQVEQNMDAIDKPNSIVGSRTTAFVEDAYGMLWIGTQISGLSKLDRNTGLFTNYKHDATNPASISDNKIQALHVDKNGALWIGTHNGLNKYDAKNNAFKSWFIKDGLPNNSIINILEDANGSLWLATNNGISKFDPGEEAQNGFLSFSNYNVQDGLASNQYISGSMHRAENGEMFFGSTTGFVSFFPGKNNPVPPQTILTNFSLFNKDVNPGKGSPLQKQIGKTKSIDLPYNLNTFAFEFTGLHFARPEKNKYLYKLKGFDTDWIDGNRRYAPYTNLDPGDYTFLVKSANSDGAWSDEGTSVRITIFPPWWRTWWAYISYTVLVGFFIFGIDRFQRKRLLAKSKERMKLQQAEYRAEAAELQAKAVEAQSRLIQSENERKSKELEEARQLQLSMLPKELPKLPHLDIAVYMQTATEVGGDYYDFHVGLDGTLTVVIGDATGHGMKAGTMVTAAKTLFNSYAPNPDILFSFSEITRCIKQLNMGKMSMCLTMLKIKGDKMHMSTAGMPPSFIFRDDTKVVEEHLFKAMPLGTMMKFPYEVKETTFMAGDTILLMSDGLPELTNKADEMYGYKRIRNGFEDMAEKAPEEIISFLKNEGKVWNGDRAPDDDVTFVVIKVK